MILTSGANENEKIRFGRARLGKVMMIFSFATKMNIIFGVSTTNNRSK